MRAAAKRVALEVVGWTLVVAGIAALVLPGPGLLMLLAPARVDEWLFAGGLAPDAGAAVLGSVWLAFAALAVAGLFRPVTFSPVLLVQFAYKLIWLLAVAAPAVAAGEQVPWLLTVVFAFWVVAVGVCLPWSALFGRRIADPYDLRNQR